MLSKIKNSLSVFKYLQLLAYFSFVSPVSAQTIRASLGFNAPTLSTILTFMIRAFFIIAGLAALLYLLLGALAWVTSGGNKENVDKARDKITAAVLGLIIIVAVLAIIVTFEQVIFRQQICLGLSCNLVIPALL
ncbi:hypothetical protein A2954_00845 [Candidatus Roizmanbacteria bacterium RIFCSPLOWO2_01_FULL_37_12]|uniref:Uncharacterized protein n=1 Tax=Candidatus Roizmanbacteria bacterium RIFCSPLOWO2_01_FULL_37_12 TaxID=1802056 RepID=A0A1F7IDW0_9BACT|nr:MAG: hypothetical protein A2954_00845 [Candidatus Roizmanbacteria bacterium RIFCSPLOWO2_01_FULL_37_12]